jgi:hypothetical protein
MTRHPKVVRVITWWRLAESLVGGLTQPKIDIRSVDTDVEALARRSALLGGLRSVPTALHRGWIGSGLRRQWIDGVDIWRSLDRAQAVRAIGVTVFVAAAVVLILHARRAL